MYNEIDGKSQVGFANPSGHAELLGMGARAGDAVRQACFRILEAQLDVVKARFDQGGQSFLAQADSGSDEIGIEPGGMRGGHQ